MPKISFAFAALLLIPGCVFDSVAKLQPEAESVTLVRDTDKPTDCKILGKITGTSHSDDPKRARKGAENELRNETAKLKGNFALMETERSGEVGTTSQIDVVANGRALFCRTAEMEAREEAQREKDMQAKEEREAKEQEEKERKELEEKEKKNKKD